MTQIDQPPSPGALAGWLVLGVRQLGLTAVTLVGVVVLGRLLGPSDFAVYGYVTVGVTLALAVGDFGLSGRIIRDEVSPRDMQAIFGLQLAMVIGLGVLGATLIGTGAVGGGHQLVVALIFVAMLLALLQTLPTAALERRQDFRRVGVIEVGQRVVFTVGAIVLCLAGLKRVGIPLAAAGAGVASYIGAMISSNWRGRPRFGSARGLLGGFAAHWWHGRLATQLAYTAYPALGGILLTARDVGHLTLSLTIVSFAGLLAPLVARATFPAMSATADHDRRPEVFAEVFRAFAVASVPALAVVVVGARTIVELGFGDGWLGAVPVIRMTCLPTLVGLGLTPSLPLLYLVLEPRRVKWMLVGWFVAQWALGAAGAELFGVLAIPVAGAVSALAVLVLLDRRLRAATGGFSLIGELAPPVTAGLLGTGVGVLVVSALGEGLGAAAGCVACLVVYAVAIGSRRRLLDPRQLSRALSKGLRPLASS